LGEGAPRGSWSLGGVCALPASQVVPHLFSFWTPIALGISLLTVLIGDLLFRKFEGNFAQEL